jgi:hypothetical protein
MEEYSLITKLPMVAVIIWDTYRFVKSEAKTRPTIVDYLLIGGFLVFWGVFTSVGIDHILILYELSINKTTAIWVGALGLPLIYLVVRKIYELSNKKNPLRSVSYEIFTHYFVITTSAIVILWGLLLFIKLLDNLI